MAWNTIEIGGSRCLALVSKESLIVDIHTLEQRNIPAQLIGARGDQLVVWDKGMLTVCDYKTLDPIQHHPCERPSSSASSATELQLVAGGSLFRLGGEALQTLDDSTETSYLYVWFLPSLKTFATAAHRAGGLELKIWSSTAPIAFLEGCQETVELRVSSESHVIFGVGQSLVYIDTVHQTLAIRPDSGTLTCDYGRKNLSFTYTSTATQLGHDGQHLPAYIHTIISYGEELLAIGDSASSPFVAYRIETATSHYTRIYPQKQKIQVSTYSLSPPLIEVRAACASDRPAIFYLPGGPHQPVGNTWDPIVHLLVSRGHPVLIPPYLGATGTICRLKDLDHYGQADRDQALAAYRHFLIEFPDGLLIAHSYGCYLGIHLFTSEPCPLFISVNGLYDLETIAQLCPRTYRAMTSSQLHERSQLPQRSHGGRWHLLASRSDELIPRHTLDASLKKIEPMNPDEITLLPTDGHLPRTAASMKIFASEFDRILSLTYNAPSQKEIH